MMKLSAIVAALGATAIGSPARADDLPPPDTEEPPVVETAPTTVSPGAYRYAWSEPRLASGVGVGVILGGGLMGFTDAAMRDVTRNGVSGLWDLRMSFGTHLPIGFDVSYLGAATGLKTFTGFANGTLVTTTAEAALRYNLLPHLAWNPYIFGGIGWQRFDVTNAVFATSDTGVASRDDVLEFPMGAGISYRDRAGLVLDLRGTFRAATNNDLLVEPNGVSAPLHSWEASGAIGYEF